MLTCNEAPRATGVTGLPRVTCWIMGRHRSSCSQRSRSEMRSAIVSSDRCGICPFLNFILFWLFSDQQLPLHHFSANTGKGSFALYRRSSLAGAKTEVAHIFAKGDGDNLERLGHAGIDVDHVDEIIDGGMETQGHGRFIDDLFCAHPKHGYAQHPTALSFEHHFDKATSITDDAGSWNHIHRHRTRLTV